MPNKSPTQLALAALAALALVACNSDDDEDVAASSTPAPAATPLTIIGTAAVGAALASGTVEVKCSPGTGTATTTANGTYTVTIANGSLPCALRVTSGSTVLHSVVTTPATAGAPLVANITPLTELLVANVAGGAPAALFDTFDAAAQARVSPAAVTAAITTTLISLQGTVDLTGVNPLSDTLVAATAGTSGNAQDALLDRLGDALQAAGTSLATLTTAVATATPTTAAAAPPVLAQVAPAASTCPALRSGTYRVINPHETTHDAGYAAYRLAINATTLTVTDIEPSHQPTPPAVPDTATFTPVSGAPCSFTAPGDFGTETLLVSSAGVIAVRSPSSSAVGAPVRTSLIVPEGEYALSQLAGTWNYIGYSRGGPLTPTSYNANLSARTGPLEAGHGQLTLNEAGVFSAHFVCEGTTCTAVTDPASTPRPLTVNPLGGFNTSEGERVFAFKTAGGAMALFMLVPNEEGLVVFVKQSPLSLPAVDTVTTFWDFTVGNGSFSWAPLANGASALATQTVTVTAVDATAQSFTRIRSSDQRVDSFAVNSPYPGLRYRSPTSTLSATVTMPLAGGGLTFYANGLRAQNFFGISVTQP